MLSAYELLELVNAVSSRVDVHWGLFITVHLALFGGIIYVDRPLRRPEKIAAFLFYMTFALVNFLMMTTQLRLLGALYEDLVQFANDPCCRDSAVIMRVANEVAIGRFQASVAVMSAIHFLAALLVGLSIAFDRAIKDRSPA